MKPTANGVRDDWQTSSTLQALLGSGEQRVGGWAFLQCSLCWLTQAAQNSRFEAAYRKWSCSLPGAAWQSIIPRLLVRVCQLVPGGRRGTVPAAAWMVNALQARREGHEAQADGNVMSNPCSRRCATHDTGEAGAE